MRRILLIGMIVIIVAAAAAGGGLVYLNSTLGSLHLLALVNEMVLKEIGLRLVWEEARGSFLFNMVAENPAILMADGDTLVTARRIRIGFRPWALLAGGMELSRVEADAPVVNILALSGNSSNSRSSSRRERASSDSSGRGGGISSGFRIRRFTIRDGTVLVARRGVVHSIEGILIRGSLRISRAGGLQIDIRRSRAAIEDWGIVVEDLRGQVVLRSAMLWLLDTRARTRDSRLAVNGSLDISRVGRRGALKMELQARDLREWWPVLGGKWVGRGPFDLEGWLRGKPWRPELELSGGGNIAGILLDGFALEGSYAPRNVEAEIRGWGAGADLLQARLALNPKNGEGWLEVDADSIRLGATPVRVPVSLEKVQLSLQTRGYDPVSSGGDLRFSIWGVNAYGIEADSIKTAMKLGEGDISTREPVQIDGRGYSVRADGMISRDRKAIDVHLRGLTQEPSQLLTRIGTDIEGGTVDLDAWITGAITDPSIRGGIRILDLESNGITVANTDFRFNVAQVLGSRIGNFSADLDSIHIEPNFDLPVAGLDGRVMGETITLHRVEGLWEEGETGLQGNITISRDSIRARLDSGHLTHRELIISDINGQLVFNPSTGAGPFSIDASTSEGRISLQGHRDGERRLYIRGLLERVQLGPFNRSFDWGVTGVNGRIGGSFSGRIAKHVDVLSTRITVERPTVAGYAYESLMLDAEYRNGAVEVNSLNIVGTEDAGSGVRSVEMQGTLLLPGSTAGGADGQLGIDFTAIGVNLAVLQPYLTDHTLIGDLTCEMRASGTFVEPRLDGLVYLTGAQLDTFRVEEVVAGVGYEAEKINIYGGSLKSMGFTAAFEGGFPFHLQFSPLQARLISSGDLQVSIAGSGNPEALLQPFSNQIESVTGDFYADIQISGTIEEPHLKGNVKLERGEFKPVAIGQAIEDLGMDLILSEDEIRVVSFTGRMSTGLMQKNNIWNLFGVLGSKGKGGDFSVTGDVTLGGVEQLRYNLHLQGSGMGISDPTGSLAVVVDSDLKIVTNPGNAYPSLEGSIQVQQGLADVGLLLDMVGGSKTLREIETIEREGLEVDVEIEIPGRLRVIGGEFGQEFDVELMGNLLLRQNSTGVLYILGTLESVVGQGQLFMFSRKWTIEEGNITFGSIEEINPNLDARFSTGMDEDLIVLTLTGTAREPLTQLSVEGNSMLGQSDIYQLLVLGSVGMGEETGGTGQLIGKYLENQLNEAARGILGVDTFDMEGISGFAQGSLAENTQLSVGRYFGNQIYAKYAQSIVGTTHWREVGVEYRLSRWFRISGMRDRYGSYLLELKWRIEY